MRVAPVSIMIPPAIATDPDGSPKNDKDRVMTDEQHRVINAFL